VHPVTRGDAHEGPDGGDGHPVATSDYLLYKLFWRVRVHTLAHPLAVRGEDGVVVVMGCASIRMHADTHYTPLWELQGIYPFTGDPIRGPIPPSRGLRPSVESTHRIRRLRARACVY
jgi:hypothetical protein